MAKKDDTSTDTTSDDGLVEISIVKSFNYTSAGGQQGFIPVGKALYPKAMLNDHFFMSHSDAPPPVIIQGGTPAFAAARMAELRRKQLADAAIEQQVHEAAVNTRNEAASTIPNTIDEAAAHEAAQAEETQASEEVARAAQEGRRPQIPQRRGNTV